MKNDRVKPYTAKEEYLQTNVANTYLTRKVYSGFMGKWRRSREDFAVMSAIQKFMIGSSVLDLPCGFGRWFDFLSVRVDNIIGMDISNSMINAASKVKNSSVTIETSTGDAENIKLVDKSVDYIFSFAFMKHLPDSVKSNVIDEFSRVSDGRMIISFAVFNPINRVFWKLRGGKGFPNTRSELEKMLNKKDLFISDSYGVGFPVLGLEKLFVIERVSSKHADI
jgi:ubiquinone/menaquinone biosynthesis C-methylase UbiE